MDQREMNQILSDALDVLVRDDRVIDEQTATQIYDSNRVYSQIREELHRRQPRDGREVFAIVYNWLYDWIDRKRRESAYVRPEPPRGMGSGYLTDGARETFGMTPSVTRSTAPPSPRYPSSGLTSGMPATEMFENLNRLKGIDGLTNRENIDRTGGDQQATPATEAVPSHEGSGGVLRSIPQPPDMVYNPQTIDKKAYSVTTSSRVCGCRSEDSETIVSPVIDYYAIGEVVDDKPHPVEVFHIVNHVPEFDILSGIRNVCSHNSRFFNGRHVIICEMILYHLVPRNCGATTIPTLDIKNRLTGEDGHIITVPGKIDDYLKDIVGGISGNSPFKDNLIENINVELKRWCREYQCDDWLGLDELRDLSDAIEKSKKGLHSSPVVNHKDFPRVAVNCLKRALESMTTKLATNGVVDMGDAILDIIKHPDFVIRKQGLTERDPDLSSPPKLEKIAKMFTVYPQRRTVCYSNFIPEKLKEDLTYDYLLLDKAYNAIDVALEGLNLWSRSIDFICEDNGDMVMYRNGVNYSGHKLIFRDDVLKKPVY